MMSLDEQIKDARISMHCWEQGRRMYQLIQACEHILRTNKINKPLQLKLRTLIAEIES